MPRNLIGNYLGWLRGAFDLKDPFIPGELQTDAVVPVVDVLQDGYGMGTHRWLHMLYPASLGGAFIQLLGPAVTTNYVVTGANQTEREKQGIDRIVTHLEITHSGGAVNGVATAYLYMPQFSTTMRTHVWTIPPITTFPAFGNETNTGPTTGIGIGAHGAMVIPNGFMWGIQVPATVAGETWTIKMVWVDLPHGSCLRLK